MKTKKIRILALAMALLTTLTACGQTAEPESSEPVAVLPGEELGIGDAADEVFSLNYNSSASWCLTTCSSWTRTTTSPAG